VLVTHLRTITVAILHVDAELITVLVPVTVPLLGSIAVRVGRDLVIIVNDLPVAGGRVDRSVVATGEGRHRDKRSDAQRAGHSDRYGRFANLLHGSSSLDTPQEWNLRVQEECSRRGDRMEPVG
jgi:hypothetical protein